MTPSIARILHYILTADDVKSIRQHRETSQEVARMHAGTAMHRGNAVFEGEHVPLIVTAVWPNEYGPDLVGINGQVILDGNDSLWITSIREGTNPGTWHWPERAEAARPSLEPPAEPEKVGGDTGSTPVAYPAV